MAKVFTKIDLRGAYNLVRIKPGDQWKTAFRTRYGHFEYNVMPFGLTNAPAVFQHMMNDVFREYLDQFVVIYLDDILIFSNSQEEHNVHVSKVLAKLKATGLYAKLEKCEFDQVQVEYLGYIISPSGISMDPKKVESVLSWDIPKTVKDVQSFLGFANFYHRFVKNYSKISSPLTNLTKKTLPFQWTLSCQKAFDTLKSSFTSAPVLAHPDINKPFIVETDASDFALGAVLSQYGEDKLLHPIAFYSRKFSAAEINYDIYDKELLAIIAAFEQWRHYLDGCKHKVTVYCDHKNLQYFTTTKVLNRRQARWSLFLASFDFLITYRPGSKQGKPDALSRRAEYQPKEGDEAFGLQNATLLKPNQIQINATTLSKPTHPSLHDEIAVHQPKDPLAIQVLKYKSTSVDSQQKPEFENFTVANNIVYFKNRLYVADQTSKLKILKERHDSLLAGHFGISKTFMLVSRDYWWPKMFAFVKSYVTTCDTCARAKIPRHQPYGLLQPLPIPTQQWQSISLDFITDLPQSAKFDSILVIVDRLTKMAHFVPCTRTITAKETADLVTQNIFRLHGLPESIISDRGPQFTSKFWKSLLQTLGISANLSTAFHPQSDGQTERVNQILEQYLRCTINYNQDNWTQLLPLAEFAYNNSYHTSTKQTPFFANFGFHPRFSITPSASLPCPSASDHAMLLKDVQKQLLAELQSAQERYKHFADQKRKSMPNLIPGDYVWLLRKNIKTNRPSDKLDYKRLGPFKIIKQINPVTFRLQLPGHVKIHNVFHVSLLEPYSRNSIPNRISEPPPIVEVEDHAEYEVNKILDSRIWHRKLQYLVDWKGYSPSDQSWEPAINLANSKELLEDFHQTYPEKPGPKLS